jgi:hypothetical protein
VFDQRTLREIITSEVRFMRRFLTWIAIGIVALIAYTYGAKAGRGRYREIKATAYAIWNDPRIKKARKQAIKEATKAASKQAKQFSR